MCHLFVTVRMNSAASCPPGLGYFLGDTKAVLRGCQDQWTMQDQVPILGLPSITVCVDVRVVAPGAWAAFFYSSGHVPRPELGLEGDQGALYAWLLRVPHRFPCPLSLGQWHRVCMRRNVQRNSFTLQVRPPPEGELHLHGSISETVSGQ